MLHLLTYNYAGRGPKSVNGYHSQETLGINGLRGGGVAVSGIPCLSIARIVPCYLLLEMSVLHSCDKDTFETSIWAKKQRQRVKHDTNWIC